MKILSDGRALLSASDISAVAACEWAFTRRLDESLGHPIAVPPDIDPMRDAAARLGDIHEERILADLHAQYPGEVVEIERPDFSLPEDAYLAGLNQSMAATLAALSARKKVVFQATFVSREFQGFADFLVLNDAGEYEVWDSKLARSAKVTALLQLAAYAEQLQRHDVAVAHNVTLVLGSGNHSTHRLDDIMPVFRRRRDRLLALYQDRRSNRDAGGPPLAWNDPRFSFCGHCAPCEEQIVLHDDLLLVADMRQSQRKKLRGAGIVTLEDLAASEGSVPGMADETLRTLRAQAKAQSASRRLPPDQRPYFAVDRPESLAAIPEASQGDIFFDFEGDPLYEEAGTWNLDYLFGFVDDQGEFTGYWGHDLAGERDAFNRFMNFVLKRRETYPDMHIYHYASYEQTHLLQLAQRHALWEDEVDELVRLGVLVNLYPIVKRSIRVGSPSYSLKEIEKIFKPAARLGEAVTSATDSVIEYNIYRELASAGDEQGARQKIADLEEYNQEDCLSTRDLRDWLRSHANGASRPPSQELSRDADESKEYLDSILDPLRERYQSVDPDNWTAYQRALALGVAAVEYHRRERKSFWWAHYERLTAPLSHWEDQRDVVVATSVEVIRDWLPEARSIKRQLRIHGVFAPGTTIKPKDNPFVLYEYPPGPISEFGAPGARGLHNRCTVLEVHSDTTVVIEERIGKTETPWADLPLALTPQSPPATKDIVNRLVSWVERIGTVAPDLPRDAVFDLLLRRSPHGSVVSAGDADQPWIAIRDSLLTLDHSYLAVQGPPGTGKTYNAGHVIADLVVNHGWRVGVVAQSHATVENLLRAVAEAGLSPSSIGKKLRANQKPQPEDPWIGLEDSKQVNDFLSSSSGYVVGGTVWTFSSPAFSFRGLDLLVIDEAGQYSLADTIAASTVARNLLLVGDPQQLPQVSQGIHPVPINNSALGWLMGDHDVLPPDFGMFLDSSWRMHPALCERVSELSYEGQLGSIPSPRTLEGVEPGVTSVAVEHLFNSTESLEEADSIVELIGDLMTRSWTMNGETKPLSEWEKNIIVVAPYNAQVNAIRRVLDDAGWHKVPVGTVDKFQGQEAPVAILSMAASSAAEVPRGIEFLLMRNRLNVAISRAQWAAFVVYSPELTEFLPRTPEHLALLSRFIKLVEPELV